MDIVYKTIPRQTNSNLGVLSDVSRNWLKVSLELEAKEQGKLV